MNDRFVISGSDGVRTLRGSIAVAGSKNEALKALPAALLYEDGLSIERVPDIEDIRRMREILEALGARIEDNGKGLLSVSASGVRLTELPQDIASQIRASIVVAGPLLARFGSATFYYPGGCLIGKRPIDVFLDGFRSFGADIQQEDIGQSVRFTVTARGGRLRGGEIVLKVPSVTATETFLLAAIGAEGRTAIHNAALEPEVHALAQFLKDSGADIGGIGTPSLLIHGGAFLRAPHTYTVMSDRIETGTFAILAALAGDDLTITDCEPKHLKVPLSLLARAGVRMEAGEDSIHFSGNTDSRFDSLAVKTQGYPGFPTDLQPLLAVFLTQAEGESSIFETIFESRMEYLPELRRMGASIETTSSLAHITGPTPLVGIETPARDLRSGMAFLAAGLIAKGETIVHNGYNIDRGYAAIEERLRGVGADIVRRDE
ncbi:MAG: UDP-N-acetylglucosamine 1-carboxyvinyltransferase [Candidatus Vogelbacteria bacterium]|nr:UDP-N-acetylglucosamine 1-carboxyvinyltransferase [Candidatus Vogelbacteria bacterium]